MSSCRDLAQLSINVILLVVFKYFSWSSCELIHNDLGVYEHTIADWRNYVTNVFNWLYTDFDKDDCRAGVNCWNRRVEKWKYNRGYIVEWVFGDVERDTGCYSIVAIEDRSANTLITLIKKWITPGTTVISDWWKAYARLSDHDYNHLPINHSVNFVDPKTRAHTNTIETEWRHFKASLCTFNHQMEYKDIIHVICFINFVVPWSCIHSLNVLQKCASQKYLEQKDVCLSVVGPRNVKIAKYMTFLLIFSILVINFSWWKDYSFLIYFCYWKYFTISLLIFVGGKYMTDCIISLLFYCCRSCVIDF